LVFNFCDRTTRLLAYGRLSIYGRTMKAWILNDSPGTYSWGEIETPALRPDEVRIRVVTSALNHMDLWVTRGMPKPPLPHIPGCDAAGIVEEIGSEVTSVAVGDEVVVNPGVSPIEDIVKYGNNSPMGPGFMIWGEHCHGGHATFAIAPDRNVRPRPTSRTWFESAAFPLAYLTALRMLNRARVAPGETVLIVGIGSGVSTAALALANFMGAQAIVTSRDAAKRAQALQMGAVSAIDSADAKWPVQADVVIESVGPATWDKSVRSLAPGGRMVVCGGTSGSAAEINIPRLFFKQYEIIGSSMGSYEEFDQLLAIINNGLPIAIDNVYALKDYEQALSRLERGEQLGKIVLDHGTAP
jgi:zinc-binding alcohol dehydrogenase/oxidoreductase